MTDSKPLRFARKIVVAVIGVTVLAFGIALIVLPGPALVVIPAGLSILATEFVWARRMLHRVKQEGTLFLRRFSRREPPSGVAERSCQQKSG